MRLVSVLVSCKCLACNRCCVRVKTLETLETPLFKNFYKKLKGGKNFIVMCILCLTIPCGLIIWSYELRYYIGGKLI